jgi:hypothetical protein
MRTLAAAKTLVPILSGLTFVTFVAFDQPSPRPVQVRPSVAVYEGDREQVRLVRWAVGRFERAGLDVPGVEIHFHGRSSGCGGHLGYAQIGRVDVCTALVNEMARRNLLHEMGHIWIDKNVSQRVRDRFLELRHLSTWNASSVGWDERGYEQGAEIVAWALGDRILTAQIPDHRPEHLGAGFELLTGVAPPDPPDV